MSDLIVFKTISEYESSWSNITSNIPAAVDVQFLTIIRKTLKLEIAYLRLWVSERGER